MSRADNIQSDQSKLQRELDELQKACKHIDQVIKYCVKDKSYRWQCLECNARLTYPNIIDLDKFIK
jgi:hypothetical protein